MAEARFGSPFFGNELTNFFFFDDRFDYRKWSINSIGKGDIYTGKKQQIFRQGSITLTLTGETYLVNNQQDEEQEATGFVLRDEELMAALPEFTWQKSNEAVEVEASDYLYKVYMSEINGREQVYSMEMRIF